MKERTISSFIGMAIAFAVLSQFFNIIFDIAALIIFLIAVFELDNAFKEDNYKNLKYYLSFTGILVLSIPYTNLQSSTVLSFVFLLMAVVTVLGFNKSKFKTISANMMFALFVLYGIYTITALKTKLPYGVYGFDAGFVFAFIAAISWGGDTSAYFAGYFFGKRKLAPNLSPKKTIEGAIGGVIGSIFFSNLFLFAYSLLKPMVENSNTVYNSSVKSIVIFSIIAGIGSVVGIYGDLFASAIKREVNIKDYGKIMPGHGGVLDRFDSVLLVTPFVSAIIVPLIIKAGGIFNV